MGVKHVEAFGDTLLVVKQVAGVFQCFNRSLNAYLDKCLEFITLFYDFTVQHVSRDENTLTNDLVQQASGFRSNQGKFGFLEKQMFRFAKPDSPVFGRCTVRQSILLNQVQQNWMFQFLKQEGPEFPRSWTKQAK
jgi:hypothetical protein